MNTYSNTEVLVEPNPEFQEQPNWFQRTFSKMGKDSLRGSIFMMLLTALGTGLFTLHHLFNEIGIVFAIVMIVLAGICYYTTADMLIYAVDHAPGSQSLSDLNKKILGKFAFVFYNTLFFIYIMLCLIAFMVSMSKILYQNFSAQIWSIFTVDKDHQNFEYFNKYFAYLLGFLLFFLIVQRKIESLRYFTLYSFFIFVFVICIFTVQAPLYISELVKNKQDDYNLVDISFQRVFSSFGILLFTYNAIPNFYTVVSMVQNPTVRRLRKIFMRTFAILGASFIVVGSIAYLSLGKHNTPDVDLFIFRHKIGESDLLMIIGRCLLLLSLATGTGMNAYPLKVMLRQAFNLNNSFKVNLLMSIILVSTCTVVVSQFTVVTTYIAFAGAFCATIMVFTYPCVIALKTGYASTSFGKALLVGYLLLITALGLASSYVSLMKFFGK